MACRMTTPRPAIVGTETVEGVRLSKEGAGRYLVYDHTAGRVAEIIRNEGGPGWWLDYDGGAELRRSRTACVRLAKILGLVDAS
jgi:hypothetical protein